MAVILVWQRFTINFRIPLRIIVNQLRGNSSGAGRQGWYGWFSPLFNFFLLKLKKKIFPNEDVVDHAFPNLEEDKDKAA